MRYLLALLLTGVAALGQAASVVDLAGRTVELPAKINRIIIGEGRLLPNLAIVDPTLPAQRLVGLLDDFETLDPGGYAEYRKAFPRLDQLARLGHGGSSFALETAIGLKPDLAILALHGHGPGVADTQTRQRLEKAGVTVIYVDFTQEPLKNTERSIEVLGQVLGNKVAAMKYLSFYRKEMQKVRDGLKTAGPAMPVFLESRVGLSDACCETIAHGMLADLLTAAGGQNLATPLIPGTAGTLSVEWLLQTQPAVYIATGVGNPKTLNQPGSRKIALGQGIRPGDAQASLQRALQRPGLAQLNAVRTGRAHALSHHFGYSAANVAAVQALAKWLHPQAFATLDPQATLQRFYQDFQPVPLTGTFWVTE